MLPSGCDAAYALADSSARHDACGRVKSFIGKMNTAAKNLGLTNTHFDSFDGIGTAPTIRRQDLTKIASSR